MDDKLGTFITNEDFFQRIAEGRFGNYSFIEKFGEASSITTATDPADVWDGATISGAELYTFSTTADIDSLSSSNAGDNQDIEIQGLDSDYNMVTQTVTLNGQTTVSLTTSLIRVFRMINRGSSDLAGNVYCFVSDTTTGGVPNTATKIRAVIQNGNNQTLMCIYTIPAGKTGYLYGGYVSISRGVASAAFANFSFRVRNFGEVFTIKSDVSCISNVNSNFLYRYKFPLSISEKSDVLVRCDEVSATLGVSSNFTILLKDN